MRSLPRLVTTRARPSACALLLLLLLLRATSNAWAMSWHHGDDCDDDDDDDDDISCDHRRRDHMRSTWTRDIACRLQQARNRLLRVGSPVVYVFGCRTP